MSFQNKRVLFIIISLLICSICSYILYYYKERHVNFSLVDKFEIYDKYSSSLFYTYSDNKEYLKQMTTKIINSENLFKNDSDFCAFINIIDTFNLIFN